LEPATSSVVPNPALHPISFLTPLITLTGFTFALLHAGPREGWGRALCLLALVFIVSLLFESVGVATGWIYGPYHYTDQLGSKFLGLVPYLIPVAWFMMCYHSFVIADRLVPSEGSPFRAGRMQRILAVAALGGLVMTAWDLIMDPIMMAGGNWVWDAKGTYFGIPLQNFWGWWLTVFTTFALYQWLFRKVVKPPETRFDWLAMWCYLVTMLGIMAVSLVTGVGGLALIGFFAILTWAIAGWMKITYNAIAHPERRTRG
jgi:uncharacterized membrane protein